MLPGCETRYDLRRGGRLQSDDDPHRKVQKVHEIVPQDDDDAMMEMGMEMGDGKSGIGMGVACLPDGRGRGGQGRRGRREAASRRLPGISCLRLRRDSGSLGATLVRPSLACLAPWKSWTPKLPLGYSTTYKRIGCKLNMEFSTSALAC